jgi:hypothetical protein
MATARKILKLDRPFPMRRGGALQDVQIAYETWGDLSFCNDNAILIFTGLSPSAHAASSTDDPAPGWWEDMIGPAHRHATLLRHLRQFARQPIRFDLTRVDQSKHWRGLSTDVPGADRRRHRARRS